MSLRTWSPIHARSLAIQLDALIEDLIVMPEARFLTQTQLDGMLREVLTQHLAKLDRVAAVAKLAPGFDRLRAEREDRRAAWVYRLLDAHGPNAHVSDADQAAILADGLDQKDVGFISDHLARLQDGGSVPTKAHVLRPLLEKQGADATAMNFAQAQQVYFQGMMLALQQSDRRYRALPVESADFVDRLLKSGVDARVSALVSSQPAPAFASWPAADPALPPPSAPVHGGGHLPTAASAKRADDRILALGQTLEQQRKKAKNWSEKSGKQAVGLFALFDKYLAEQCGVTGLTELRQTHLARFINFLQFEIYKNYGKSAADHSRTISQLLKIAKTKKPEECGVEAPTLNRHLSFLKQLFVYAKGQGVVPPEPLETTPLRARQPEAERERNARPILKANAAERVFKSAPFTGCMSWEKPLIPGDATFHRALYYVPMLLWYQGGRREEFCGLTVDDVILDNGPIPYIHIAPNKICRIKNKQSVRNSPLHPDVLRLGFLDYVAAVKALGYLRLFPDLHSPSTQSPLGDRFYDEFRPVLTGADTDEAGFVIHSLRRGFGDALKQKRVVEEERAEMLGHKGKTETTERYCDAYEIQILHELICKVPVVTAHMEPRPLRLLPWVQEKQIAPFSRQVRKQPARRAKATKVG